MSEFPRLPARSAVVALAAVAACALLAAGGLTAVVLADDRPAPSPVATDRPSPTARPATSREPGPPTCLLGTWRTVDEQITVKFYTDQPELPLHGGGRVYELRPDGTGTERMTDVVFAADFRGNRIRMVGNGTSEFTWSATDRAITYRHRTTTDATWAFHDQRGHLSTHPLPADHPLDETEQYTCTGAELRETNESLGFRSAWVRTTTWGVYGG
ncbi:hypothetical protein [Saccharothrix xinjiangensis]|uniref:Lipocalin-like protein n=1 Tax=Saccharothrix xinjiangensis TaxID=204798 RepID=A0ABV9XZ02_9PSEU